MVHPDYDEELIHKMRTTIKKMRALSAWSGVSTGSFFRKYYKAAGRIRDVQVLLKKIKSGEYESIPSFNEWLEDQLNILKNEWQESYDGEKISKQFRNLKNDLEGKNHKQSSLKFAKEKEEDFRSLKNTRPLNDEQIHEGRKTIKEIDFLNKWEKKRSDEKMKKVSEETGNFMDTCSAIKMLDLYIQQELNEEDELQATALKTRWENNKEADRIKISGSIDSLNG